MTRPADTCPECGPKLERIYPEDHGKCVRCGWRGRLSWQIMLPDNSFGFLCEVCGLQASGARTRLIPDQGSPSALEFFLDRSVKVYIAGRVVSGVLIGFTENRKMPHQPAVLILETKRGPTLIRGSWQKITGE